MLEAATRATRRRAPAAEPRSRGWHAGPRARRAAASTPGIDRFGRRRGRWTKRAPTKRSQLTEILRAGERAFVDARLERVLERDHQLDAIERTQPELLQRRLRREVVAAGIFRDQRRERIGAVLDESRRGAAALHPVANRGAFQFPWCRRCAAAPLRARSTRAGSSDGRRAARWPRGPTASTSVPDRARATAWTRSSDPIGHADHG